MSSERLIYLPLGGAGEVGMNAYVYGYGKPGKEKLILVDLGVTFPDMDGSPGVDLILPDISWLEARRNDLEAVFITHAHEDHIGAIPYFAADLGVPLYATPFTAELVRRKLEEADLVDEVPLHIVRDGDEDMQIGPFGIRYLPLAHSIAEGNALLIDTPYGRVFHTGETEHSHETVHESLFL